MFYPSGAPGVPANCLMPDGSAGLPVVYDLVDRVTNTVVRSTPQRCIAPAAVPAPPPDPPSAIEIWQAVGLPTPGTGVNPRSRGIAGLDTWLWYTGPMTRSVTVTLNGFTVTAEAHPTKFTWHLGNGESRSSSAPGSEAQPAVKYPYRNDGTYTITVEVTWSGSYTVDGAGLSFADSLGSVTIEGERTYPVLQLQAVRNR